MSEAPSPPSPFLAPSLELSHSPHNFLIQPQNVHRPVEDTPGPAERAGVAVGDVILGINYVPLEKGLVRTAAQLTEAIACAGFVKLQVCVKVSEVNLDTVLRIFRRLLGAMSASEISSILPCFGVGGEGARA